MHSRKFGGVNVLPFCVDSAMYGCRDGVFRDEITTGKLDFSSDTALDCLAPAPSGVSAVRGSRND